jgi:hypothetical protein
MKRRFSGADAGLMVPETNSAVKYFTANAARNDTGEAAVASSRAGPLGSKVDIMIGGLISRVS